MNGFLKNFMNGREKFLEDFHMGFMKIFLKRLLKDILKKLLKRLRNGFFVKTPQGISREILVIFPYVISDIVTKALSSLERNRI